MYSNHIVNFQDSTTILNAYTKKSGNLLKAPHINKILNIIERAHIYEYYGGLKTSPTDEDTSKMTKKKSFFNILPFTVRILLLSVLQCWVSI